MHITALRMKAQQITRPAFKRPAEVVAWLGAVQAQDYTAACWAVGLRLAGGGLTEADINQSVADGEVLRLHAMRGTWQLITPADARWMVRLVAGRLLASFARRYAQLGLDGAALRKGMRALEKALVREGQLTRTEIARAVERAGFTTTGERLSHLLGRAELEGLICSGGRNGKHRTFALLDVRAPGPAPRLARDEALAELARRYFRSRGPATLDDFVWWSGLTVGDARAGLEAVRSELVSAVAAGRTYWLTDGPAARPSRNAAHLLPFFDEYIVGYRNRQAAVDPKYNKRLNSGGGMLNPSVILDGQMIGTWRRTVTPDRVKVELSLFQPLDPRQQPPLRAAAARYARFLGLPLDLTIRRSRPAPRPRRSPTRAVAVHLS